VVVAFGAVFVAVVAFEVEGYTIEEELMLSPFSQTPV
jgi:hypothetical protein